ncbi:hypothetical protein GCM10023347_37280 [Streptomyces chumphonensis]|uniref:Uncharacterized protein n=1 Tax=Streptomyces chumphonensis TaxID=1214925 RepID=A0A927IBZ4_9ACTN|nr:hypothetical protein [Streptomyces chumphonensis]MBD3930736.1 hypothetical protein [Streptomyces chumphonensis]
MSHQPPPPPPPPGPYGQQPPQPNPYGAPPAPYPPYGNPQSQPAGPYAQPTYGHPPAAQGPYAPQQPYGQAHLHGGQAPPPPPRRRSKGKAVGLTVGALAVVGALVAGVVLLTGGDGSTIADDGPHRLDVPQQVGDYRLSEDDGGTDGAAREDAEFMAVMERLGISDGTSVQGSYSTLDPDDAGTSGEDNPLAGMRMAFFGGVWGEVEDPERAVDDFFRFVRSEAAKDEESTAEFVGDPEAFTPEGFEGAVLKCQEVADEQEGVQVSVPLCVWGDHSTVGMVMPLALLGTTSMEAGAQLTADFRAEARVRAE